MNNSIVLRVVLALVGAAIIILGLNIGLGGIRTLGWQLPPDFISVTNEANFKIQDNHIRFIGGVWFGVGASFLIGAFAFAKMRPVLIVLCLIIVFAGLFRASAMDTGLLFSAAIAPSLLLELVGFPLLAWWLMRSGLTNQNSAK